MSPSVSLRRAVGDGLRALRRGLIPWAGLTVASLVLLPVALGCGLVPALLVAPALALVAAQLSLGLIDGAGIDRVGLPSAYQDAPGRGVRAMATLSVVLLSCAALTAVPLLVGATLGALYADHPTVVAASWVSFGVVALAVAAVAAPRALLLAIQIADQHDARAQVAFSAGTNLQVPALTLIHLGAFLVGALCCGVGLIPASLFATASLASVWRQQHAHNNS